MLVWDCRTAAVVRSQTQRVPELKTLSSPTSRQTSGLAKRSPPGATSRHLLKFRAGLRAGRAVKRRENVGSVLPIAALIFRSVAQLNSKAKGEISEGVVLAHLLRRGWSVSIPFGNNQRYDLILDDGVGRFVRVQVKTGTIVNGCVSFKAHSVNGFTGKSRDYMGQADIFIVYCPQLDKVYRVPVSVCGRTEVRLRVEPARGGSKSTIRWAKDFEL